MATNFWMVALASYNYDIYERQDIESMMGAEYDAGCWSAQMMFHRLQLATSEKSTDTFFLMLEIGDLGSFGQGDRSSLFEKMNRTVQGSSFASDLPDHIVKKILINMIFKTTFIVLLYFFQVILIINPVSSEEKYIEIDTIVAIAETRTITKLELDNKKARVTKSYLEQNLTLPNDKKITKQALDQLITEKLVIEFASNQGIGVSPEQLNNVINNIAKSNNISNEEMIKDIESDGTDFNDFREDIRRQLIFDQVKGGS